MNLLIGEDFCGRRLLEHGLTLHTTVIRFRFNAAGARPSAALGRPDPHNCPHDAGD